MHRWVSLAVSLSFNFSKSRKIGESTIFETNDWNFDLNFAETFKKQTRVWFTVGVCRDFRFSTKLAKWRRNFLQIIESS